MKFLLSILGALAFVYILLVLALGIIVNRELPRNSLSSDSTNIVFSHFSDGSIRYSEKGEGDKAILFLHGFNGSLEGWGGVFEEMKDCGRLIRIDIPGYGGSVWKTNSYDLEIQSKRVYEFLVRSGVKKVTLVGASMGASLSARVAADYPDLVYGVVLAAPSGYPDSLKKSKKLAYILEPGFMNKFATGVARSFLFKTLYPNSSAVQALTVTASYGKSWLMRLEKIEAPVVIVWSPGDATVPYKYAGLIAEHLKHHKIITLPQEVGHSVSKRAIHQLAKIACTLKPDMSLDGKELLEKISSENISNIVESDI